MERHGSRYVLGPHAAQGLASLKYLLEWLSPARDMLDMKQGGEIAWQGLSERDRSMRWPV